MPLLGARECGICGSPPNVVIKSHELKPVFNYEKLMLKGILKQKGFSETLIPEGLCFKDVQNYIISDGIKGMQVNFGKREVRWKVRMTKAAPKNWEPKGSDLEDVLKANEYILREKEEKALEFLKEVIESHPDLPLAVSFSGGKDSAVVLALTRRVNSKVDVVFLNTTIELPETVSYTRDLAELWDLNFVEIIPSHDFLELCHALGPPSRFMKWCCKTQKFSPMNEIIHQRYSEGVIMVRGVRASESVQRRDYKKVGKMKWTPKEVIVNPILDWGSLETWLYIFWRNIPYNRAYEYGFARLGCWACPAKSLRDFKILDRFHPELVEKLHKILRVYSKRRNLHPGWIPKGEWRYRKPKVKRVMLCASRPCFTSTDFVFSVDDPSIAAKVLEFFKIFGKVQNRGKEMLHLNTKEVEVAAIRNHIRIKFKDEEKEHLILRLVEMALNCVDCGACQAFCEHGAIKVVEGKRIIDEEKCVKCLKCLSFPCIALRYGFKRLSVKA